MKRMLFLGVIVVLLIAACGGSVAPPDAASADPPVVATEVPAEEAASVDTEVEAVVETEIVAEEEVVAEAEVVVETETVAEGDEGDSEVAVADIGPPPAFNANLKATNPDNVVLGNGKPQVVEFFAFW